MTFTPFELVQISWYATAPLFLILWFLQRFHQNAAIADIGFCVGFALIIIGYGLGTHGDITRRVLLATLGTLYGFRLGAYLLVDRVLGKTEDARYRGLRKKWGNIGFFVYFQSQAIAISVFSLPLLVLMENTTPLWSTWEIAGTAVWIIAITGETMADQQLASFRSNPHNKGKTCRNGIWRYSRHPNYFFEGLHWCAYVVMGIKAPYGWVTLIGPVFMVWALCKVSGIPLAEAQALISRGEEYREYQRTTSAFIPWFPKKLQS